MLFLLGALRIVRAMVGVFAIANMLRSFAIIGNGLDAGDAAAAKFTFGLLLLLLFAIMRWLINIPYVRVTGSRGINRFFGL